MPVINTTGVFPDDSLLVRSIMFWPGQGDLKRREQQFVAELVNGYAFENGMEADITIKAHLLQTLLEAPGWEQIKREITEQTRRATVAAYVLLFSFAMEKIGDRLPKRGSSGASLSKAFFLVGEWAKTGAVYGDGSPWLGSHGYVKKCWAEFKTVSHLWAAMQWNRSYEFAPPREVFFPDHLVKFMMAARYFQEFGQQLRLNNHSKSGAEFLLPADTTWLVRSDQFRAIAPMPSGDEVFLQAPFIEWLHKYEG